MACPAGGHAPCGGAGAAPLQSAHRVNRRGALSVDPLAPQVTLEQPEHFLSTMPAPGSDRLLGPTPYRGHPIQAGLNGRSSRLRYDHLDPELTLDEPTSRS